MLAQEIDRAKQREASVAFDRHEAKLKADLPFMAAKPLDEATNRAITPFVKWAADQGVRSCAAKPGTVAAYVLYQGELGIPDDTLLERLNAIERLHDAYGLPNPVATAVVAVALDRTIKVEPPRSWPKQDKARFARLPADIRATIERRERERDVELRRLQNKSAAQNETSQEGIEKHGQETSTRSRQETASAQRCA